MTTSHANSGITRRELLSRSMQVSAAAGILSAAAVPHPGAAETTPTAPPGRLKLSVAQWCFEVIPAKWTVEKTCQVAKSLGCASVELVSPKDYSLLKQYGLTCALGQIFTDPDPPFVKGFNNPAHWPKVMQATRLAIDAAAAFSVPNVIAFTGFSAQNPDDPQSPRLSPEEGAKNCVAGLKQIVGYAEQHQVTLCLEMLNTRDRTHPMKGHPGYQGDHLPYCLDIIKAVGSPRLKLLFDVYHVQIMGGDVIRNLRQYHEYVGHVHVAGVPGRNEIDDTQEINYPGVMRALADLGYAGYVGLEFIPTRDPEESLRQAVKICTVS